VSGEGCISKCVKAERGTGVGRVLAEAAPPAELCPEGWVLFDAVELLLPEEVETDVEETALVGVPVERFEPVEEADVDALLTVLFWVVSEADELPVEAEESCVPWVVDVVAVDEGLRVVTELAAEVFLPEVELAAAALVLLADPCT
jgi:hypothetical protein